MLRLLNNLQLIKVTTAIIVAFSCSVIFRADLDYICLFQELLMVVIAMLLSIILGLLSVPFILFFWLFIDPFECLMEYTSDPPAILETQTKKCRCKGASQVC